MTQYREGQEVEVRVQTSPLGYQIDWRKAKIVGFRTWSTWIDYHVEFPDGTRGVFSAEHIRAAHGKFVEWPNPPESTAQTEWSS